MSDTTKIIKATIGNVIFAFSIGIPLTILTALCATAAPMVDIILVSLLFGGLAAFFVQMKMGGLTLFIYLFYCYLFARNRRSGILVILFIHYTSLIILALLWKYGYYSIDPYSLHLLHFRSPMRILVEIIASIPAILLFIIYNAVLLVCLFKDFCVKNDGQANINKNLWFKNRYEAVKFVWLASLVAIVLLIYFICSVFILALPVFIGGP